MTVVPYAAGTVTIGTTATIIATVAAQSGGILVNNSGSVTVYVGPAAVTADQTATGGFPIAAGATINIPSVGSSTHSLYGIVASSTAKVSYIQPL